MRAFEISVRDEKVVCDIPKMHVPPDHTECFAVYLKKGLETQYKLKNVKFEGEASGPLTQQGLNDSVIIVKDENRSPGELKFTVALTPREGNPKPADLDPIFVNE